MNYWVKRNLQAQRNLTDKSIEEAEAQLSRYYARTMERVIGQFESIYNKLFSSISEGKQPTPADLYKLDTYWQMQRQLQEELRKLGNAQAVMLGKRFSQEFMDVYESLAIPGVAAFSTIDAAAAEQMINQIWCADGLSWSQRIWNNTELLQEALNANLIECVVAGRKPTELKNLLQEQFNVSYNRADALVRTEMAHIQTQAAQQRYTDYGIKEVEVWASKDERRCEHCGKLHQKRYPIGAHMPIPAHPNCRCSIIPVV